MTDRRFDRNERFFGSAGQTEIGATAVAIVGLGGLGSHVAQQLAYLGTERFVLVDHDWIDQSSLNRVVEAIPADAAAERPKIDVAARMIAGVRPEARVAAFDTWIDDPDAKDAVRSCHVIFGCLDTDGPRFQLVELSSERKVPYFDLATDIAEDGSAYGGRLLVSMDGERCLFCMDMLDQRALRAVTQSAAQAMEDERIYGVRRADLGAAGPSVVSLNGVIASLAVTEYMLWITGKRPAQRHLVYRAERGLVLRSDDPPRDHCPYCGR